MADEREVLIVDDSEENVAFMQEILEEMGLPFRVARNGKEGIEALKQKRPDLVLLDVMMPRKSGLKVFQDMKRDPDRPECALCVDMIAPEGFGEIIGGSQREDELGELEKRLEEHSLPKEPFQWYLDLRRYGSVPHGGFGMGIERLVTWICGLQHIRESIPFPRMLYRMRP